MTEAMLNRVEDIEFLLSSGCGWGEVCTRLGATANTLEKACYRAGRLDLAIVFSPKSLTGKNLKKEW